MCKLANPLNLLNLLNLASLVNLMKPGVRELLRVSPVLATQEAIQSQPLPDHRPREFPNQKQISTVLIAFLWS